MTETYKSDLLMKYTKKQPDCFVNDQSCEVLYGKADYMKIKSSKMSGIRLNYILQID